MPPRVYAVSTSTLSTFDSPSDIRQLTRLHVCVLVPVVSMYFRKFSSALAFDSSYTVAVHLAILCSVIGVHESMF